jgi:hypothetical protein
LDLAEHLPKTIQLDGYDISSSQYPSEAVLADNMSLNVLDAFGDVPPHLAGKYDVVHLRFWCCVVKGDDPSLLIRHAMNLLSIISPPSSIKIYVIADYFNLQNLAGISNGKKHISDEISSTARSPKNSNA